MGNELRADVIGQATMPKKKGRWLEWPECLRCKDALYEEDIACSCCGAVFNTIDNCTELFKYCPNCGAFMAEEGSYVDKKGEKMIKKITFLELLQMIKEGTQPNKVDVGIHTYKWNGHTYLNGGRQLEEEMGDSFSCLGLVHTEMIRYAEPILDDREKRFVKEAMVPLRVKKIKKRSLLGKWEKLDVEYSTCVDTTDVFSLPFFKSGTMYKGMEINRWYTIKELLEE